MNESMNQSINQVFLERLTRRKKHYIVQIVLVIVLPMPTIAWLAGTCHLKKDS